MAFNIMDIMNAATLKEAVQNQDYKEIVLNHQEIIVTKHNQYSMNELEELATGIEMDGLQQPLVLGRINGEWWLASGHRRLAAIEILISEGKTKFENIPCRYKEYESEIEFKIALLIGNTFNRKMSDFDLMNQAREWKEVLTQAKKEGIIVLEKGQRIRDYVMMILGESDGKIATLEAINNKAIPEVKEEFKKGNMGITHAYETSKLPPEEQKEIAKKAAANDVKCEEIKAKAEEKKSRREEEAKTQNMSDTDTTEEEKENARKLHSVKMIEKYYIYLSEEEVEILERILEDCKRRKREYHLDEE